VLVCGQGFKPCRIEAQPHPLGSIPNPVFHDSHLVTALPWVEDRMTLISTDTLVTLPAPAARRTPAQNRRRILCLFPRYTHSFGTLDHAFPLAGVKAFMPPQGLLVIAAYLPAEWDVRFIDENVRRASDADFRWADAVFISGMHVQRQHILEINRRAQALGKVTILGGPSVSGCPEWYPEIDLLHVGELGDATDRLIERLDRSTERPSRQEVYTTAERLPLDRFPTPAYEQLRLRDYFLGSIQFSSGCPYRCEFCDIPELYGRNPRLKSVEQVIRELDAIVAQHGVGAVYFVDDNFIGNRKAALELLRGLVKWQQEHGYPLEFACEATLNLAQAPEALELMREAGFGTVFCGIETPEEDALQAIQKKQNLRQPILEAVQTINGYGLEVVSGIILGLDTDTADTGDRVCAFVEASAIPMLTINLLHALPRTPLWRRLAEEGRLLTDPNRDSNVEFRLPYDTVVAMWRRCITRVYDPAAVFARFEVQCRQTYPHRKPITRQVGWPMIVRGLRMLARVLWHGGVRADYRRTFWRMALPRLRHGEIEEVIHIGLIAHHLIMFARECAGGGGERSFYAPTGVEEQRASSG